MHGLSLLKYLMSLPIQRRNENLPKDSPICDLSRYKIHFFFPILQLGPVQGFVSEPFKSSRHNKNFNLFILSSGLFINLQNVQWFRHC